MLAGSAGREATERRLVRERNEVIRGMVPKYRRFNVWDAKQERLPNTANWTTTARPLPYPPPEELANVTNRNTISQNPHLFNVSTPINIDKFEFLLKRHPNPRFVASVVTGLREGFWPCADTNLPNYPTTHDAHIATTSNTNEAAFLANQINEEVSKGRFSEAFGPNLLPGMYSMPIHAVPKDGGSTFRMVNNHSAEPFSLNSMIDKAHVPPSPLDNMSHVGHRLICFRHDHLKQRLVMWKADVSEAYRLLPVHRHWQLKQVITFGSERRVDWRNCFGGRASGALWIAFMALVTWIAIYERQIINLIGAYVDDSFGFDEEDDVSFYCPYSRFLPRSQALLLELWDELGIPHKEKKQVFGSPLTIIGFDVDPNTMTITLPIEAKNKLIAELDLWIRSPVPGSDNDGKFKLREWQILAGWINWALNMYPPLRPSLNRIYPKMSGQCGPFTKVWVNNAVRFDLTWARDRLRALPGSRIMDCTRWEPADADIVLHTDACLQGMGFWYDGQDTGYYSPTPVSPPVEHIFYFEALCALSALRHAATSFPHKRRFVIYTDNTNTVDIFSSFRAEPAFNHILLAASDIIIDNNIDLRVLHVPGASNTVADAISRLDIATILDIIPSFYLSYFQPPRFPLGALQK